jgi:hypothetical protein
MREVASVRLPPCETLFAEDEMGDMCSCLVLGVKWDRIPWYYCLKWAPCGLES